MIKYYIPENYLEHHGIKGQKWGVRRYQNYDGTLTAEGKKRLMQDATKFYSLARQTGYAGAGGRRGLSEADYSFKVHNKEAIREKNKFLKASKKAEKYSDKGNKKKASRYLNKAKEHYNKAIDNHNKAQAAIDLKQRSKEILEEAKEQYDIGRTYMINTYGQSNVKKLLKNTKMEYSTILGKVYNYKITDDDDGYGLNWDLRKKSDGSYEYVPIKYKQVLA